MVILSRNPRKQRIDNVREVGWDAASVGAWAAELEGATALVNLTGRSVNCVHTEENRREILDSRLDSVRALGAAVKACRQPPTVWVQCSATGYYGDARGTPCDETAPPGRGFMAEVCGAWEGQFAEQVLPETRKVVLRLGVALGNDGGAYPPLRRLTRLLLGGAAGSGAQGMSWIHVDDVTGMMAEAIANAGWEGVYNACAPEPATNAEFMRALRQAWRRPWVPPAPEWAVLLAARWVLRTDGDLILAGARCVPRRALAAGYEFKYAQLKPALGALAAR